MVGAGERRKPMLGRQGRDVGQRMRGPSMRALLMLVAVVALLHARLMTAVEDARRDAAHPRRLSSSLQARIVTLVAAPATPTEAAADSTLNPRASFDPASDTFDSGARLGSMSPVAARDRRPEPIDAATAPPPARTPVASPTSRRSAARPSAVSSPSTLGTPSATKSIAGPPGDPPPPTPRTAFSGIDPAVGPTAGDNPAGSIEAGIAAIDPGPPTTSPSTLVQGPETRGQAARASAASDTFDVVSGTPTQTYPTRPPPAATLKFSVRRGAGLGTAELAWRPRPEAYTLTFQASGADGWQLAMASRGTFDAAGLAPDRFTERRTRRSTLATNFQRASAQVSFSASPRLLALREGEQDRLTWLVQVAAIMAADPAFAVDGATIALPVAGLRGESEVWTFAVIGLENVSTSSGLVPAFRLHRAGPGFEPDVDVWLDPTRHHLPVRVSWSNGVAAQALELLLEDVTIEP